MELSINFSIYDYVSINIYQKVVFPASFGSLRPKWLEKTMAEQMPWALSSRDKVWMAAPQADSYEVL